VYCNETVGQAVLPAAGFLAGQFWLRLRCKVGQTIGFRRLPSSRRSSRRQKTIVSATKT
jgi:hypothetical protein